MGVSDYTKLENYRSTFAETSKSEDRAVPLINDNKNEIFNLDRLAQSLKGLRGDQAMASCDAYYIDASGRQYLFEFKDQPSINIDAKEIHRKVVDSIALLLLNWQKQCCLETFSSTSVLFVIFRDDSNDASFLQIPTAMMSWMEDNPTAAQEPLLFKFKPIHKSYFTEIHTIPVSTFNNRYFPEIFS